jgi:hypothetical protein
MYGDLFKLPIGSVEYRNRKKKLMNTLAHKYFRKEEIKHRQKPECVKEYLVYTESIKKAKQDIQYFLLESKTIIIEEEE